VSVLITILSYATGAVFILLTFPVALLLRLLTFPFDRHRLLVGWSLVWLGRLFIRTSPLWEVTVEGTLPAPTWWSPTTSRWWTRWRWPACRPT
jgi:1-acyl-sn-glycerol-3-phosphate acyltransferase